ADRLDAAGARWDPLEQEGAGPGVALVEAVVRALGRLRAGDAGQGVAEGLRGRAQAGGDQPEAGTHDQAGEQRHGHVADLTRNRTTWRMRPSGPIAHAPAAQMPSTTVRTSWPATVP